jgi:hypothetical protein
MPDAAQTGVPPLHPCPHVPQSVFDVTLVSHPVSGFFEQLA